MVLALTATTLAVGAVDLAWLLHDGRYAAAYAVAAVVIGGGLAGLCLIGRSSVTAAILGALVGLVLAGSSGAMLLFEATAISAGGTMLDQLPSLLFGGATAPDVSAVIDAARVAAAIALGLFLVVPPFVAWSALARARAERERAWSDRRRAWLVLGSTCVVLALTSGGIVALEPFEKVLLPLPEKVVDGYFPPGAPPSVPASASRTLLPPLVSCDASDRLPDGRIHCFAVTTVWKKAFKVLGVVFAFPALSLGGWLAVLSAALELAYARFLRRLEAGHDPGYVAVPTPAAGTYTLPALYADADDVALLHHRTDGAFVQPLARVPAAASVRTALALRLIWAALIVFLACAGSGWLAWALVTA